MCQKLQGDALWLKLKQNYYSTNMQFLWNILLGQYIFPLVKQYSWQIDPGHISVSGITDTNSTILFKKNISHGLLSSSGKTAHTKSY